MVVAGAFLEHPFPPPTAGGVPSRPAAFKARRRLYRPRTALAVAGPRSEASGTGFYCPPFAVVVLDFIPFRILPILSSSFFSSSSSSPVFNQPTFYLVRIYRYIFFKP